MQCTSVSSDASIFQEAGEIQLKTFVNRDSGMNEQSEKMKNFLW